MRGWRDRSDRRRETLLAGLAVRGRVSDEDPVRECPSGPEPEQGFTMRPNICVQSDPIAMTHDLAPEGESI
jgi:hypothetical protein